MQRPKILIVDDKPENIFVLSRTLQRVDADIIPASNGNDALKETLNHHFALAILDIQMPEMDGYELAELLRGEEQTTDLPIILLSAVYSDDFHEFKGYRSGAVDFIRKPFNPEILLQKVKTFIDLDTKRQELEALNKCLEVRVEEEVEKRRRNEQLMVQQSKMAEMGQMLSIIAHQWRQPINSLSLLVQDVAEAQKYNELTQEYLEEFTQNCFSQLDLMSQTIDDFRNFYKPSKEKVDFELSNVLDEIGRIVAPQLKHHRITLIREREKEGNVLVHGYPNEFKQVVMNIINNARDAITAREEKEGKETFRGELVIELVSRNGGAVIRFVDNGGGIPEDKLQEVFNPHYTSKAGEKGTGIGLHMAKMIIEESMGGRITAQNEGEGALFIIELETVRNG